MWTPFKRRNPRVGPQHPEQPAVRELAARADELFTGRQLESAILLEAAEHYANAVEGVRNEEDGRAACDAVGRGYAIRLAEEERGISQLVPAELARTDTPIGTATRLAGSGPAGWDGLPDSGVAPWPELAAWARAAAASASADRQRMAGGRERAALVDYERAFRFGYVLCCCEQASSAPADLRELLETPPPPDLGALLVSVDALLERGAALYVIRDTEVALAAGVLHGLGREDAPKDEKDGLAAAARAGYALRRAEEHAGFGAGRTSELRDWLVDVEGRHPDLMHWQAMQAAAWAIESGELDDAPGHPERTSALTRIAEAAAVEDASRAARFGCALRTAEASLPLDPARLLQDD